MKTIDEPANSRSRHTRSALLDAARELIEQEGVEKLSMARIADKAGVSRRAVYLHFASRTDLMTGLFDHVSRAEGLDVSVSAVWSARDSEAALTEWANHIARYHPRILAVDRAVDHVRRTDPDAEQHRAVVINDQQAACRRLARWLADEGRLAAPWSVDTATDMLWALMSSDMLARLLSDRGWSAGQLADQLATLLNRTFIRASGPAPARASKHVRTAAATLPR